MSKRGQKVKGDKNYLQNFDYWPTYRIAPFDYMPTYRFIKDLSLQGPNDPSCISLSAEKPFLIISALFIFPQIGQTYKSSVTQPRPQIVHNQQKCSEPLGHKVSGFMMSDDVNYK